MIEAIIRYVYWVPFRFLIQSMPLSIGYWLADKACFSLDIISISKRDKLNEGLASLGYIGVEAKRIRRGVLRNLLFSGIEVFHFPRFTKEKMLKLMTYQGLENLDNALQRGKGVILLHGHFGNEELLMPAIGYLGYKVNQIASRWEPQRQGQGVKNQLLYIINEYAYRKKISYREKLPVNFIYIDSHLRDIYKVLQSNEVIMLAADGREGQQWIEVDFLGQTALYSPGPMKIALKTDAAVLPTFILRQADRTHRVFIHEPLALRRTGNIQEDVLYNTKKFIDILSDYAFKYPIEYLKVFLIDKPLFKRT